MATRSGLRACSGAPAQHESADEEPEQGERGGVRGGAGVTAAGDHVAGLVRVGRNGIAAAAAAATTAAAAAVAATVARAVAAAVAATTAAAAGGRHVRIDEGELGRHQRLGVEAGAVLVGAERRHARDLE